MASASQANNLVSSEHEMLQSAPMPHERVVYWGSGSPQAWRILIALEEKRLPYRSVCISFSSGVLKTPFFRALNPRMRIPVLVEPVEPTRQQAEEERTAGQTIDATATRSTTTVTREGLSNVDEAAMSDTLRHPAVGMSQGRTIVYESGAILAYLEKAYYEAPCMPRSPALYAVAQSRLHESNEILSVVGDLVVYLRRFPHEKRNVAVVNAKWASVECELRLWETYLDGHQYLVDPNVPYLCDFTLFTNIAYAVRCGLQLDGLYPRLASFYVRLCARASIETTWPPHWRSTFGSKVLTKTCCTSGGEDVHSPASPTSAQASQQSS
ncbi:unnamed protein product [Hyaloperonospora brassicae]|uniref:GST N-terminal domain-containing protein n=1 Tax=Hyaloperonospora brassicae TaxID=162125 RepID=A0AAV0SXX3_HYABA|nr:unnamed protein product [Hyaloperonospora brassicae]